MNSRVLANSGCWISLTCLFLGSSASVARSGDVMTQAPAAPVRWAADGSGGVPEFQRHVVPLLGKLGCNNRACHGSFQGQSGFRLSLFGHDPKMDYAELAKEDNGDGPRIDTAQPGESLVLYKPTHEDEHEGGQRMVEGGWQYRLMHDWIATGARFNSGRDSKLVRLVVDPAEMRFDARQPNDTAQLRTRAYFSDSTFEDVTALTSFSTNDESIAEVTGTGVVRARGRGDTSIVATFAGAVTTSQVIVPVAGEDRPYPPFPQHNQIDEFVSAKLRKLGIHASQLATDEVFLRRVFLDLIGTLPTAQEARQFLADESATKRTQLIDQLLERPEYSMYWATKFDDWTGNDNRFTPQPRAKTAWLWHDWLRDKLKRNVPYDEICGGFLMATTREGRSVEETLAEYEQLSAKISADFDNGIYAARRTNDLFWRKAGNNRPDTMALRVSYAFLGVRLECAKCHKHPFDRWTQDDFKGFSSIFASMGRGLPKDVPKGINQGKTQQSFKYQEIYHENSKRTRRRLKNRPPRLLGGEPIAFEEGEDPRVALWEWMRSPANPFFARSITNRVWAHYFGVGIVEPVDDFNAANPPSNPELLDWLAHDFVEHGFDLKHLHRTILSSRTYQLSWIPNDSNRLDRRNFSHALLRRMPAEVVLDAINQTTGGADRYNRRNAPPGVRTINLAVTRLRGGGPEYMLGIFGRPLRTQTCDCERSTETGLAQAMYLLNDVDVNRKISDRKGRLARLLKQEKDDRQVVEELYLACLSRRPADEELQRLLDFIESADTREAGMQDVLWSLLNLREFVFIH